MRLSQDFAGLGGDVRYLRTDFTGNIYKGLTKKIIASGKLSGGYVTGWGGDAIQINDRFFKGNFDFRGYDTAGIGPRQMQNSPLFRDENNNFVPIRDIALGGNAYGIAAAEVSFPLGIAGLLGSLWVEAGGVGLLDEEFKDLENVQILDEGLPTEAPQFFIVDDFSIRAMSGASIFWESPFGPIRFDFTKPLRQFEYDERKSFQFTTRTRF